MTETFKVGDEVIPTTCGGARATVEYGPYTGIATEGTAYLVKMIDGVDAGKCVNILPSALKRPAKFKAGDKVRSRYSSAKYTVEAGPYFGHSEWYAINATENGKIFQGNADELEADPDAAEIKIGDRVRVLVDDPWSVDKEGDFVGKSGTVTEILRDTEYTPYLVKFGDGAHGAADGWWYCKEVEKVGEPSENTVEYDGVIYDVTAEYRDSDGDVWTFARVGEEVRGTYTRRPVEQWDERLAHVVRSYGPLTRV